MKDYDAYLFDWDGTLAKSHDMWLEIMRSQIGQHAITLTDEQIVRQLFGRYDDGMRELGFSDKEITALTVELEALAKSQYPLVDLFPNARQVLELLKVRGKKLALVTATYRDVVNVAVTHHALLELFDVTVAGDEMQAQKPDPSGLIIVLERLHILPNRAVMIGDSPKDLLAAANAGTDSILFYPPEHETQHPLKELQKCNPIYTVRSWQELLDQLQ
ncbi:MAG: HAD family hydrolase [Candidatus Saccharimonadales bacterium]